MKLLLLFHTIKYLKFKQLWSRFFRYFRRYRKDVQFVRIRRSALINLVPFPSKSPSLIGEWTWKFLNEEKSLFCSLDWDSDADSKLWRYNLHYFDYLNSAESDLRFEVHLSIISRWIAENPVGRGTAWEPYPISIRVVNWIKWSLRNNFYEQDFSVSLFLQARVLRAGVETHLLGNHVFANAKALLFAGLYFEGDEAFSWIEFATRILNEEIFEQILPDGGHFELSPMYHSIILEDVLDIINFIRAFGDLKYSELLKLYDICVVAASKMIHWLECMIHPDGGISFFNDAAFGIASSPHDLFMYSSRLSLERLPFRKSGVEYFESSGYVRVDIGAFSCVIDVADVGPDYIPGHAHADSLSFELCCDGRRVLVNGGTSRYGSDSVRHFERSTAFHNTVVIDSQNSSEVWSGFRVARRARVKNLSIRWHAADCVEISALHDGYLRLRGKVVHRRTWRISSHSFDVIDEIQGGFQSAVGYFHLHPDVLPLGVVRNSCSLSNGWRIDVSPDAFVDVIESYWAEEFGKRVKNSSLSVVLSQGKSHVRIIKS